MRGYLSIRWKILLMSGIVMAALAGLFSLQQHFALNSQFQQDQAAYQERMRVTANRLLNSQNERLQVLGRMLVETPAIRTALAKHDRAGLMAAVDPLWSELSLGQGLAALAFFDANHQLINHWGDPAIARLSALSRLAQDEEKPQVWLGCAASCTHQVVLPVAGEGGDSLGSIAVVTGLESIVLDLRRLGNGEVGVLMGMPTSADAPLGGMQILSVSGGEPSFMILQAAQRRLWESRQTAVALGGQTWQVAAFSPEFPGDGLLHFAVLVDVTSHQAAIRQAGIRNLAWGGGVLVSALALLYILLRPAMSRIGKVSQLLPLLGQERFAEVVQFSPSRTSSGFLDEMHSLERLAFDLAHQLQALHDADEAHVATLAAQAAQLEQERDLVAGLLDTAPVLIITYGRDDRIRMANAYAVMDSGFPREQLIGHEFSRLFMEPDRQVEHHRHLATMRPTEVQRGEGRFNRHGDGIREVVWFHSCLDDAHGERLFLSVGLDVTEHRLAEQRLQLLVDHDAVTGLYNRRTFKRELDALLAKGAVGMLLICDLDEFRSLNDADGHEAGDQMLMRFAQHIQHIDPMPSLTARLGSDEFALVFPGLNTADAILMARHLNRVASLQSLSLDGRETARHLSASVGLAALQEHGTTADTLLGNAELALTHARAKGHGSWHLYSDQEAYRERADRRAYWRDEVEAALDEQRFVLHFQPIINILTGEVSHHEALLRMVARDGKLIPPGLFIDVAESTGLIRRIDRWVLEAAVYVAAEHREVKLAFNLSSRSFDDDVAFESMQAAMERYHVAGERLLIEITETAALANFSGAKRIMARFQELGCVFGLDDFGVGYSSFQYLKELPVGFVKIDGSFIKNLTKNPDDVVFVRALNSAVQGFGKTTVAEFVEDEETLDILREIGVDYAQGYLIGKPAAAMRAAPYRRGESAPG
jgi:diguanylate cyclase (GGDEF)-like protein/PAS domain S-box-containing protein